MFSAGGRLDLVRVDIRQGVSKMIGDGYCIYSLRWGKVQKGGADGQPFVDERNWYFYVDKGHCLC